jgi:cytochrome c-type biogenesis protein CcmH/NrfG
VNTIYSLQIGMLLVTLALLLIPFRSSSVKNYILVALFAVLFSVGIYQFTTDKDALNGWLTHGQEHYQLLEKFNALGGVDGAITRVKAKLAANPNDKEGWMILGKLYLSKQDIAAANAAFAKAR